MPYAWSLAVLVAMLGVLGRPVLAGETRAPRGIVTLLPRDAIPAILDPRPLLVPARTAKAIADDARILGISLGGEAHAYPIVFLSWHEIVNDVIGGRPVAATW